MTNRLHQRIAQHRERWSRSFNYEIIFRGNKDECLTLEAMMRPTPGIGWNIGVGGFLNGAAVKGIPKTPEHREKIRRATLRRYADKTEHIKTSVAVKHSLRGIDRCGQNNHRFGKHCSPETKQRMRDAIANRGGISGTNNPNYRHGLYAASGDDDERPRRPR